MASRGQQGSTLSAHRAFVLHLGPAGRSGRRRFTGQVEHLPSGRSIHFSSLKELLAFLTGVLDASAPEARPAGHDSKVSQLAKLPLASWNFIGHDPRKFRHYGPMAQDFFSAFGSDDIGTIGTPTTINSTDMAGILMIAAQAQEQRSARQRRRLDTLEAQNDELKARVDALERLLSTPAHARASADFRD